MSIQILTGDCRTLLTTLPDQSVHCCVTSPPYFGLRDYGVDGQIGLELTPDVYVAELVAVFREVRRVLRDDGTLWLNLGDSYAGSWGNQGRKETRGTQRAINGGMLTPVMDGRYPAKKSNTGAIPAGSSLKPKDLIGIPWMLAFELRADGWYLREDIIWSKPNPMPESVTDRCTKAHEYIFLLSKSRRYYYDADAIAEEANTGRMVGTPVVNDATRKALRSDIESRHRSSIPGGQSLQAKPNGRRNKRSVWTVTPKPFKGAHFATFPPALIEPCIKAGCPIGGTVLDPFGGAGTTGIVADRLQRKAIVIELNPAYVKIAKDRLLKDAPLFADGG